MTIHSKFVFVYSLMLCTGVIGHKLPVTQDKYLFVRRSQLTGMVNEASHAAKGILKEATQSVGSRISKGAQRLIKNESAHFNNNEIPKSILRPKQLSPSRSKVSNRVSFHNKHVVQPSSSSKHTMKPFGGSLGRVEEHKPSKKINKQESFKNPWGHSSNTATSKPKPKYNNEGSKRSQPQGSAFFQSMHSRQQSQRRGATSASSTVHSPAPTHHHTAATHPTPTEEVEKPVKGLEKVARDYPGLGFAVTGSAMILGTTSIVTHNMRAKEEEVMRKKKELGVPPVDLSKERKAAEEKLQKQAQASNPNPPPAPSPEKNNKPAASPPPPKGNK